MLGWLVRCLVQATALWLPLRLQRLRSVERTEDCTVLIPAENPTSVTVTASVQRVAVHVVFVIRATGAAVSCGFCEGDWLVGGTTAAGGAGTVADQALWL